MAVIFCDSVEQIEQVMAQYFSDAVRVARYEWTLDGKYIAGLTNGYQSLHRDVEILLVTTNQNVIDTYLARFRHIEYIDEYGNIASVAL